jgi:Mce-associated membrane protein
MPTGKSESGESETDIDLTSAEAAEQAAAEAEARADAARARADELRRKLNVAGTGSGAESSPTEVEPHPDVAVPEAIPPAQQESADDQDQPDDADLADGDVLKDVIPRPQRRHLTAPRLGTVAATAGVLLSVALLTGTGWMMWENHKTTAQDQRSAQFSAAARQGVVNLMSMDYTAAKASVQRVLDDSTGKFHNNIQDSADDLVKAMEASKVKTTVTVNDSAVDSWPDQDTAVVLVTATSEKHDATQPPDAGTEPRVWRVMVTVTRAGGQNDGAPSAGGEIKVSDVEFL